MYPLRVNGTEEKAKEDPRRRHQAIWAGNYSTPSLARESIERGGRRRLVSTSLGPVDSLFHGEGRRWEGLRWAPSDLRSSKSALSTEGYTTLGSLLEMENPRSHHRPTQSKFLGNFYAHVSSSMGTSTGASSVPMKGRSCVWQLSIPWIYYLNQLRKWMPVILDEIIFH